MAKVCPTCAREYGDADLYCPADGTTLQALTPGDDLIGTVVADRYLITDKIGEGGMGRVYLGRHVRLPQNVAIKVLHPAMVRDATVVARFRREAVNASQIENEHVARVFDHGEVGDGLFYIAMEFVEGEPLSKIISREGPLPPARAAEITRQVADALAAAHERPTPIVHRDLKPDNIMVGVRRDGSERVKVVDFGIAEAMSGGGPKLTQQGLVIGTPEYMSPEQLSAITLDCRSDIYSLALVTFDMLTGELPFVGESPHEAALMRLRDRPRTLAEAKGDVAWPPALQEVMDRALARAPADRYSTAPEFARALGEAVGAPAVGAGVTARTQAERVATRPIAPPPSPPRGRTAAVVSAAVLVVVLAGVGLLAWRGRGDSRASATQTTAAPPNAEPGGAGNAARTDSTASPPASVMPVQSSPSAPRGVPSPTPSAGTATAPPSTSTPASPPAAPASGPRASLDQIESMIVRATRDTVAGKTIARAVLDSARAMVPRFEERSDIVELGVYTVAAYLILGRKTEACQMLGSIGAEAEQVPKFTDQVKLWNERLDCQE
jgi:serine/threonine-protein kinase